MYIITLFIFIGLPLSYGIKSPPSIAIIGGGIGGTSCAFFLRQLFGEKAVIDLYEKEKVGGRLATINVCNKDFEAGGAIILHRNKYMVDFAKLLKLKQKESPPTNFGLYDGTKLVFAEDSSFSIVNTLKLLWKYGYDFIRMNNFIKGMLNSFDRIYKLQEDGHAYETVIELLNAMDPSFPPLLTVPARKAFIDIGLSKQTVDELLAASMLVNYGHFSSAHGFVGAVSIAGSFPEWAVEGGNKLVPKGLLQLSNAQLRGSEVKEIRFQQDSEQYKIFYSNPEGITNSSTYDAVILATPLTVDKIGDLKLTNLPSNISFPGKFHRTVATFVNGTLNSEYFGDKSRRVNALFSINEKFVVHSIAAASSVTEAEYGTDNTEVWKIFSDLPLSTDTLKQLFKEYNVIDVKDWLAYPHYFPLPRNDNFHLHKHLYHINAVEWAASAMEMSSVGSKNVALLLYNNWMGIPGKVSSHGHKEL